MNTNIKLSIIFCTIFFNCNAGENNHRFYRVSNYDLPQDDYGAITRANPLPTSPSRTTRNSDQDGHQIIFKSPYTNKTYVSPYYDFSLWALQQSAKTDPEKRKEFYCKLHRLCKEYDNQDAQITYLR